MLFQTQLGIVATMLPATSVQLQSEANSSASLLTPGTSAGTLVQQLHALSAEETASGKGCTG